jgi:hypothetical protein
MMLILCLIVVPIVKHASCLFGAKTPFRRTAGFRRLRLRWRGGKTNCRVSTPQEMKTEARKQNSEVARKQDVETG